MVKLVKILFVTGLIVLNSVWAQEPKPQVRVQTSQGELLLELEPDKAPKTVANFLRYVDEGFYDNTTFHRVIAGFMIQGGGYTRDYQRKSTHEPIPNEADNGLKNQRGTVAMARTSDPNSATAQFFINHADNSFLNHRDKSRKGWGYTVFGRVIEGMEVVDRIATSATGAGGPFPQDVPKTPIVIEKVERVQ